MARKVGRIRSRTQRGRRTFFLDFRPHGRVYSMPGEAQSGFRTKADATQVLEAIRAEYLNGKSLEAALSPYLARTNPTLTLGWKYQRWLDRMRQLVASGERSPEYLRELVRYGRPGGYLDSIASLHAATIRFAHLEDLDADLASRRLSPKTRSHVQATLKTFYRWLVQRQDVAQMPSFPTVTVPDREPRILEPEDQRRVLDAISDERRGIFLALAYHGIRPSEACRLDVADYDWTAGVVRIPATKAKTRKSALVPFGVELRGWIAQCVDPAGRLVGAPLFQNRYSRQPGKRWTVDALEKTWATAIRGAGVSYVGLYEGTKHSSATAARRRGIGLDQIQAALRHADIRSTERYARAGELTPVNILDSNVSRLSLADNTREKS
jgi:integrase